MKRKILAILLAVVMAVGMLPMAAFAEDADTASGTCGKDVTWSYSDGVLTIEGTGPIDDYMDYDGMPGPKELPWTAYSKEIHTVIIKDGVTKIQRFAFHSHTNLTSITIPTSVTYIDNDAFYSCSKLNDVYYGGTESQWEQVTIYDSTNSAIVTLDATVHFADSEDGEPTADANGFVINENGILLGYVGDGGDVVIPDGVTTIGMSAFEGCTSLTSVTIPNSVTHIGAGAFFQCSNLKSVTISDRVSHIGLVAFFDCENLTDVYYGGSAAQWGAIMVEDGNGTFRAIADGRDPFASLDNVTVHYTEPEEPTASGECGENVTWTLVDNVLTISGAGEMDDFEGEAPWADYRNDIQTVIIEKGVTTIGDYAFYGYASLTSATIPEGVTYIGTNAFAEDINLASVTIPEGVTYIGSAAFAWCSSLTSVNIPVSVTTIGASAFTGRSSWELDVYYGGSEEQWDEIVTFLPLTGEEFTFAEGGQPYPFGSATIHFADDSEPTEPTEPETGFTDVKEGAYYYDAVQFAVSNGLVEGDGKGNFNPKDEMTRAQAFTVLARLDGETVTGKTWKDDAIAWVVGNDISDGSRPDNGVTREELAVMLYRFSAVEYSSDADDLAGFADSADVHSWAVQAMAWAVENGIVKGNTHGELSPRGVATRAEAVTMIQRYCEYVISGGDVGGMGG